MKALWEKREVLICVGTGGVGKTSVSATLGLAASSQGRNSLVMTIDPAHRLAHALGLSNLGHDKVQIPNHQLMQSPKQAPFWVMMPDVRRTFDDLLTRLIKDPARQKAIFSNRLYQQFASAVGGSLEYAALEKLCEVYETDQHDLIVLDTPPSAEATQFFNAPKIVSEFLNNDQMQWFLRPYLMAEKMSAKLLDVGRNLVVRTLSRFAGAETVKELIDFLLAFHGLYEGLAARAAAVEKLLHSEKVGLVLVTAPRQSQQQAALKFAEDLKKGGFNIDAVVVNRMRPRLVIASTDWKRRLAEQLAPLGDQALRQAEQAVSEEIQLGKRDEAALAELKQRFAFPITWLPELEADLHDLNQLKALCQLLMTKPVSG